MLDEPQLGDDVKMRVLVDILVKCGCKLLLGMDECLHVDICAVLFKCCYHRGVLVLNGLDAYLDQFLVEKLFDYI